MEKLLEDLKKLNDKWFNDRQKLIDKAKRTIFNKRYEELTARLEQAQDMQEELLEVYHNTLDRLKSDNN